MQNKKSKVIKVVKLEKHDIVFDELYVKRLLEKEQIESVKAYVKRFFFRYKKEIFIYDGAIFDLYNQLDAVKMIPNDLCITQMIPDEVTKKFKAEEFCVAKYLKSTDFMKDTYKPVIDFTENVIFSKTNTIRGVEIKEHFINLAKPYGIDRSAPMVELTPFVKGQLKIIDDHLLNVLCSKNPESYKFNKNFFACTFAGRKLRKCLYWQSPERTGKGVFLNGLIKKILGDSMYKTSSVESLTTYTKPFEGCVLINPDELPVEGNSWKAVADKLKGLITEPEFDCRTMHQTAYLIKNTFNVIITTNNNAVTMSQTNNKRYHTNDIDESKIGDSEYFKMLTKVIENPVIALAYYQQMMLHFATLKDWNEDEDQLTESKQQKMIEALPRFHKYVKETYVLKGKGIYEVTNNFFDTYFTVTGDKSSKIQIGKYLKSMGIESIKIAATKTKSQHYKYSISVEELYKVFVANKWLDVTVDLVNQEKEDSDDEEEQEAALQLGIDKTDQAVKIDYQAMYLELLAKNNTKVVDIVEEVKIPEKIVKTKKYTVESVGISKEIFNTEKKSSTHKHSPDKLTQENIFESMANLNF